MCDRPFFTVAVKHLFFIVLALAGPVDIYGSSAFICCGSNAGPSSSARRTDSSTHPAETSGELDRQDIDSLVAVMGDEQVRRLLIDELKTQAAREQLASTENNEIGGIAGFIHRIKNRISFIRERIEDLKTSDGVDIQEEFPAIYKFMGDGEKTGNPARAVWNVILVFAGAMLLDWVFRRYLLSARKQIEGTVPPSWSGRLARLTLRAVLDCLSIGVFTVAVIIISYAFLANTPGQRVLVASYLAAIVIVRLFAALFRFLFAVDVPALRILPLSDAAARYLSRWLLAVVTHQQFWFNNLWHIASGRHA